MTINVIDSQEKGAIKIMSNYGFVSLRNPGGDFAWSTKTFGVRGTPTSFLVDPEGKIVFNVPGLETVESTRVCDEEVAGLLKWTASPAYARAAATPSVKAQP